MKKEWYRYKNRLYHKVGEYYNAGITKLMLLPEEVEQLHLNHEHLILVDSRDPELVAIRPTGNRS